MKKLLLCLTVVGLLASCEKEGPQGPQGPAGADGAANIKSITFTSTTSMWTYESSDKYYWLDYVWSDLTIDVAKSGLVLAYYGDGSGSYWNALPVNLGEDWLQFSYQEGFVFAEYGVDDNSTPDNPGAIQFKFVIIPPSAKLANPDVDWNNYSEVSKRFGLEP